MITLTDEQRAAVDAMMSGKNVFLTGEAGTGKSTVLREFRSKCDRECVVLAPTGIAAVNAGGATIHSFFMLKPGLMTPDTIEEIGSGKKRAVIRAAKTIIIDEISMVRSDVFAAMDIRLRSLARGKNQQRPFGGKQMILVGDFFQLPPVVKTETEDEYLKKHLGGGYSFQTDLWANAKFKCIFLKTIHRQQNDSKFLSVLNSIRHGELDEKNIDDGESGKLTAVEVLNKYCVRKLDMPAEPISLCTTNREAQRINAVARARSREEASKFNAVVSGKFPEGDYPTEVQLELMKGVRVMLLCNRRLPDGEFEFVNGDMGVVSGIGGSDRNPLVNIKLDRGREVSVGVYEWKNYTYVYEEDKISGQKVLRQKEIGKFLQVPLRLAYAITIHKSQGLSLDCVDLKLGSGCFTHGQLYTALSRCRTLKGLRLDRTVMKDDLILDEAVIEFYKGLEQGREPPRSVSLNVPPEFEAAMRAYLAQLQSGGATMPPQTQSAPAANLPPITAKAEPPPVSVQPAPQPPLDDKVRDHIDLRKLMIVYGGQTGEEKGAQTAKKQNGVGFNKFDAPLLTPIAESYMTQGWVHRYELNIVSRAIQKYHSQWEGLV